MIAIAVWLGVFLEDYESHNPCPPQCKIDHEHRIKNDKNNSIRPLLAGAGGVAVTWLEWLPVAVRILVGLATFVYICVKIYKLYNE